MTQQREGDQVAQLVGRRNAEAVEEQGRADRFDDAQKHAADHRAGNVADAAEHRRAERLDARQEAHEEVDLLVDEAVEHAADAGHAGAEHEGEA